MRFVTCSPLTDQLTNLIENCADLEPDTLCTIDDATLSITSEIIDVENPSLAQIISLANTEPNATIARLNREDLPLHVIMLGDVTLENTSPRSEITVTATRNVNLRSDPSRDATVIGSMTIRQDYTAIGRLADNTWIRIRLEDGRVGWASAQFFVTQEGFTALETTTPTTPSYLPMQSLQITTEDCGLTLIVAQAPDMADDTQDTIPEPIIFGINGAQITVDGIVALTTTDEILTITSIIGDHTVNAFGFEVTITNDQQTTIPLSSENTIASIPTDSVNIDTLLNQNTTDMLTELGK
ncbi:MAG: SH3 domain-containing protein [Chloroflexota bacterium]